MSEEMAVSDNATGEEAPVLSDEATADSLEEAVEVPLEQPFEVPVEQIEDPPPPQSEDKPKLEKVKEEPTDNITEEKHLNSEIKHEPEEPTLDTTVIKEEMDEMDAIVREFKLEDDKRGIKRRASDAFSDDGEVEFLGFADIKQDNVMVEYNQVLERLEAEVSAATKDFVPVRFVMATPPAPTRANKRARKDTGTDGSRPSSAQSSRSEDDNPSASPAARGGRRPAPEMSSPLLRVPLARGWRRELVYRAALDLHSRRNADIYYYTPKGKKLRSTREISENLSGTGLTLENFSFFKEPLGVDDPEKEIIRDAKVIRRVESPIASPAPVDGKRTHKPKAPKGASPEPPTPKSPPAKLKQVKSVGSRLSGPAPPPPSTAKPEKQKKPAPAPAAISTPAPAPAPAPAAAPVTPAPDNNNSAAWKKPRAPAEPAAAPAPRTRDVTPPPPPPPDAAPPRAASPSPPRLAQDLSSPEAQPAARRALQPCSLACGAGVPSLSCAACLCMYHPACAGHPPAATRDRFLCKNCRKSTSPPHEAAGAAHKPAAPPPAPAPRRLLPAHKGHTERRVTLRMKVSGGSDGSRVWAVAGPRAPRAPPPAPRAPPPAARASLPQSLATINGKRFIVVPRPAPLPAPPQPAAHEGKVRGRVANGATVAAAPAPAPAPAPARRRGRPRADDTDHFTGFYNRAQRGKHNIVVQIFSYLGMRDLAHCARVCKLWKQLAATPTLWRHVRMKNSQVSDWGGLCAALKRHGTKWLDLRKMLLPQNDTVFWEQFAQHIATVDTLERLEMCRCPAAAVEAACGRVRGLRALSALAIRDAALDPAPLACATQLRELRLKSMAGLALTADLTHLAKLTQLTHLSLTSIKELGWRACDVIGSLGNLESLELGECTFRAEFAHVLARLTRLTRLRLERGTAHCAAPAILRALAQLPRLTRLELVNIDVKVGFDDALAECKNIQRLLIIPTYVSQSATTNKQVLSGVLRLKDTLTHLMWGVTIELLRVTELFIDQCSAGGGARRELGECIPVLKPVPGCRLPMDHQLVAGPPQVEILPLPTLQRLLSAQLPNTKLKLLRIPFHATWRQSLADFQ